MELINEQGTSVRKINKGYLAAGNYTETLVVENLYPGLYHLIVRCGIKQEVVPLIIER
jgi:hypothetical protein